MEQVSRAAVSNLSNIAEGFERDGNPELIHFLSIAKGSCGEVRAQLMIASDQAYMDQSMHNRLQDDCRRISRMLSNLIAYLRRSPIKGLKYSPPKMSKEMQAMLSRYVPSVPESAGASDVKPEI